MTPVTKTFTFGLPDDLKAGLQAVKERDGTSEAEQIRRAIAMWLKSKGVIKATSRRGLTRRKV
jgi:predicted transcriptional regulator